MKMSWLIRRDVGLVLLLTAIGAILRLWSLGKTSLQIDNIMLWDLLNRDISASAIFSNWIQIVGVTGQLPLAPTVAKLFWNIFQLPPDFQTMILPFSLLGSLAIPVAWLAGREFGGSRMAFLLAALTALSPMAIQMSREAYFYAPVFLGAFLALWAAGLSGRLLKGGTVPRYFHAVNAAAFWIMTWSSPSTWPWAFFFVLFHLAVFGWQFFRQKRGLGDLLVVVATYGIIGLPLLLAPWGLKQLTEFTSDGATKDYWSKVFEVGRGTSSWSKVWPVLCAYALGTTPIRQLFSALIMGAGLLAVVRSFRHNRTLFFLAISFVIVLMLNILAVEKSVWVFGITRIVPLVPFFLLLLSAGLLLPYETLRGRRGAATLTILPVAGLLLWVGPALLVPRMTGLPRPYSDMARWADQHLPEGTPVLTERFFTAYNEFRVHAPEKVQFVSTVPNQIPEQYHGLRFREQTQRFFDQYPDAAFYEEQHQWKHPEIGPWPEIRTRFSRVHTVTNTAGYQLARMGLFYRGEPELPAKPDDYSLTIYYNTTDDLIAAAKRDGASTLRLWGPGWGYAKPGWQQGDFRDYRLLRQAASAHIHNLTESPLAGMLEVTAATAAPQKVVQAGSTRMAFSSGQIRARNIPVTLQPGKNEIVFTSPSDEPLFVLDIRWIQPAE